MKGEFKVNKIIKSASVLLSLFLLFLIFCSNPANNDVKWRSTVELPITSSKKFYMGAMFDTLFFNSKQVLRSIARIDTIVRPGLPLRFDTIWDTTMILYRAYPKYDSIAHKKISDTIQFGFPTRDTVADTLSEDSLEDKYYSDLFGPIPIQGTPNNSQIIPLSGAYTAGTSISSPSVPISIKYVYRIDLMDTVQYLNIDVTNNTSTAFSALTITLGTLGSSTISNLAAGATQTAQFDARAKVIDSVMNVTINAVPASSGNFAVGNNLTINFSLNGLKAFRVIVMDSLLKDYQRVFTNEYDLTDTVDVNYIDIDKGFFIYSVTNHTGMELQLSVIHRHLWRSDFCQRHVPPLISLNDLAGGLTHNDSVNASNCDIAIREAFPAHSTNVYSRHNISQNRLFPQWNPAKRKTVTMVDYKVSVGAYGRRITLTAGDSLAFVIKTTSFKFQEMAGRTMEKFQRASDSSRIPVNLPWPKSVTDSLRNNFVLQKVLAAVRTRINMPEGAFIDTVRIKYDISSITNPAARVSSQTELLNVTRDSLFYRPVEITNVVNDYPESLQIKLELSIPSNTKVRVVNDLTNATDPDYTKYIGRMILKGEAEYQLLAPLCWSVVDTAIMDLGGIESDISGASGAVTPLAKMTDKHASFNIQVTNNTNIHLRLYALAATDSANISKLVDTANPAYLNTNQFYYLLFHPTANYINILGNNGLLIPPRDSLASTTNTISLSDQDLSKILSAKKMGLRWLIKFMPQPTGGKVPDALFNTDWIQLNSWIHIDGVMHIDSLDL